MGETGPAATAILAAAKKTYFTLVKYANVVYIIYMGKQITTEEQLRRALAGGKLSRYRLAQISGLSEAMLSLFLRGKRSMGLNAAEKLAKAMDLELRLQPKARKNRG